MNAKLIELGERRATLVSQAEAQREELSQRLAHWRSPIFVADRGWAAFQYLGKNPVLLGGAVGLLFALRPWRMAKWLPPGWFLWRTARIAFGTKRVFQTCKRKSSDSPSPEVGNTQTSHGEQKKQG